MIHGREWAHVLVFDRVRVDCFVLSVQSIHLTPQVFCISAKVFVKLQARSKRYSRAAN